MSSGPFQNIFSISLPAAPGLLPWPWPAAVTGDVEAAAAFKLRDQVRVKDFPGLEGAVGEVYLVSGALVEVHLGAMGRFTLDPRLLEILGFCDSCGGFRKHRLKCPK